MNTHSKKNGTEPLLKPALTPLEVCKVFGEIGASLVRLQPRMKAPVEDEKGHLGKEPPARPYADFLRLYQPGQNIGIRMGLHSKTPFGYLHALDVDTRNPKTAQEARTIAGNMLPEESRAFVVKTGSGTGEHWFFFSPVPLDPYAEKGDAFEVALKGTGTYVVGPGSIHPDTGARYELVKGADFCPELAELVPPPVADVSRLQRPVTVRDPLDDLLGPPDRPPVDWNRVESALRFVDAVDDRDVWLRVGWALHDESGDDEAAYRLWCDWSERSSKFDPKDQRKTWDSFCKKTVARNPVTVATIFDMALKAGWWPAFDVRDDDFPDLPKQTLPLSLIRNKNGSLAATLSNASLTLEKACRINRWEIRRNEFSGLDEWNGERVTDAHLDFIQAGIEQAGMSSVGKERTFQAMRMQGSKCMYHPVRDYLDGLRWDGKPRLVTWLTDYAKVKDAPYVRGVASAFLIGMVARIMRPGCKMDTALVLRGAQGLRKSTACAILAREWYGENMPAIVSGNKDADQYPPGHWLIELAENAPTKKADQDHLKAFISRRTDELRLPYGRMFEKFERQSVFVVTTNQHEFLRDDTGGRRWWPVTVESQIDTEALARDRDQLFAEAKKAFDAGEPWHLTLEMERLAAVVQEDALESDPWEEPIRDYLDGTAFDGTPCTEVRIGEVLTDALRIPIERQDRKTQHRVSGIMRNLGWEKAHTRQGKRWVRCDLS